MTFVEKSTVKPEDRVRVKFNNRTLVRGLLKIRIF